MLQEAKPPKPSSIKSVRLRLLALNQGRSFGITASSANTLPSLLTSREIPSLNGIRAVAALAVVISHIKVHGVSVCRGGLGAYAVICFFVLSGFLITNLLLQERLRTGGTSLSKFYARRTLRIFPAFWVLCAIFLVVSLVLHRRIHWPAWIACVFYVSNYYMAFHGFGSTLNHSWSLAIEEQFYLLWPAAFRRFAANSRHLERILVGVILAVWIYRAILEFRLRMDWVYIYCAFGTRADALAIGCLLAILAFNERIPHWLVENKTPAGIAAFIIVMVPFSGIGNGVEFYLFPPAFAVLILHAIVYHRSRVYHWLNWAPVRQIGMWSYSIYLYHIFSHRVVPDRLGFIKMPLEILVALALGAGSYYLVEKPVLALRDRWFVSERS